MAVSCFKPVKNSLLVQKVFILLFTLSATYACSTKEVKKVEEPIKLKPVVASKGETDPKSLDTGQFKEWLEKYNTQASAQNNLLLKELSPQKRTETSESIVKSAHKALKEGRKKYAITLFSEAARLDPENLEVLLILAKLYIDIHQTEEAFAILKQIKNQTASSIREEKSLVYRYRYVLALAYAKKGEQEKSRTYLSELIEQDPNFTPAYISLAATYIEARVLDQATFILQRANERIGDDATIYTYMGLVHRLKNEVDSAEMWLNKALEVDPHHTEALINRATLNVQRYNYESAAADVGKVLSTSPMNAEALQISALILFHQGELEAASDLLVKVIDLSPLDANARFNLALIEETRRNIIEARRLMEEVLHLEPQDSPLANRARMKISGYTEVKLGSESL